MPSGSANCSKPSDVIGGYTANVEPVWRGHEYPRIRGTATCNGWFESLGSPGKNHCVGSVGYEWTIPSEYFSVAVRSQLSDSNGTFIRVWFVTFKVLSNLLTSSANPFEVQKASSIDNEASSNGIKTATLLSKCSP